MLAGNEEPQKPEARPEIDARHFELAKLDYERLATQEQRLLDRRPELWPKFFTIVAIPGGYAGLVGLKGAIFLLCLVPFFLACLSLDVKHDEQVLRYDVRKRMKQLARAWGYANHDSRYSQQEGARWWAGCYKYGRLAAFLLTQLVASSIITWYLASTGLLLLAALLGVGNVALLLGTGWCLR